MEEVQPAARESSGRKATGIIQWVMRGGVFKPKATREEDENEISGTDTEITPKSFSSLNPPLEHLSLTLA